MLRRLVLAAAAVVLVVSIAVSVAFYWLLSGDAVRQSLEAQASRSLQQPVHIGAASARVFPRVAVHLSDVRVGDPVRLSLAAVDLSAPLRAMLGRRIEDATVTVSRSRIDMPLPFTLAAPADAPSSPSSSGVQLVSIRAIALRDITIVSRGRALQVSADAAFSGGQLAITSLTASSGATTLRASGIATLTPRVDAQVRVAADRIDVDELLSLANAFTPPSTAPSTARRPPARIAARISAATVRAGTVEGKNFATSLQVDGDDVRLSPMSVQLFGGRYEGAMGARLGDDLSVTLRSRITGLDVASLAAFGGAGGTLSGTLSGAATFDGSGRDFAAVLRNVRGDGTASIVDGSIAHLDLLRTVVLFFGRPSPAAASSGNRFERIDVRFTLADQTVRADALAMHSMDADMVGQATLALPTQALSGRVDVALSEALSQQAGTDFARYTREGNRIVLPATISGRLGAPRLGINTAAAIQRGLRNEVQRRLGDLLGRLSR